MAGIRRRRSARPARPDASRWREASCCESAPIRARHRHAAAASRCYVQDRAGPRPLRALESSGRHHFGPASNHTPGLVQVIHPFQNTFHAAGLCRTIDRTKRRCWACRSRGFFDTLSGLPGFGLRQRFHILVDPTESPRGRHPFRLACRASKTCARVSVTNDMVPLGSVALVQRDTGPYRVPRYNRFRRPEWQGSDSAASRPARQSPA